MISVTKFLPLGRSFFKKSCYILQTVKFARAGINSGRAWLYGQGQELPAQRKCARLKGDLAEPLIPA